MKQVVIIGGGIIGLASAYFLKKQGMEVTVLEKGEFGMACSKGNQGWVCPALHEPVPAPGLVSESFQMLLKKDSPLYIKPSAMPQLSGWLTQFMKFCNEGDYKHGEKALLTLSKSTLSLFNQLEQEGVDVELHKKGILFAYLNEDNLQKRLQQFEVVSEVYGHEKPVYKNASEIKEMEPILSNDVKGGIFLENQYHIRPETLSKGFVAKLKEIGAKLYEHTEVLDLERTDNNVMKVKTEKGMYQADYFLLAAGAWSDELAKKLQYKLPMTAGKGYSITITNPTVDVKRPLYLGDLKAGITPFNQAVRMGGTMELSGKNTKLDKKRLQGIRLAVSKYLQDMLHGQSEEEWVGLRPMTPDGLPMIGKMPQLDNMFLATGHAMVGMAMAPATGKIIADLIVHGETAFDIAAFRPERFMKQSNLSN